LGALSGIPDLEHITRRVDAPLRYAERLVGNIMEKGAAGYEPITLMGNDLETASTVEDVCRRELLNVEDYGLPEENVELLRQLWSEAHGLVQAMQPAQGMMPGQPGPAGQDMQGPAQPQFPGAPPQPQL
jgi:hypothetical protein